MMQRVEKTFAGRKLVIETGRMAKQAAGSAVVQFGDTMVLAALTVSDNQSPQPFFPLLVEYREKTYAAGKIPGGFIKREGRPSDNEILSARIVDRSIRPLFPEGFKNEVQVFIYIISADQENAPDVLALVAASAALNASKIPFTTPVAATRVGRVQGNWILNPTDKHGRIEAVEKVKKEVAESLLTEFPDNSKDIKSLLGDVEYNQLRSQVLDSGFRVDGRKANEVRPISIDTGLIPRAHGSALFTRGQTQALVTATPGTANDV